MGYQKGECRAQCQACLSQWELCSELFCLAFRRQWMLLMFLFLAHLLYLLVMQAVLTDLKAFH